MQGGVMGVSRPLSQEPFDLQRANVIPFARPAFGQEEPTAVYDAVMSDEFGRSGIVPKFEQAFAEHVGVSYAIAVSSCTTALHLGLAAWGIGVGDEIVVPSLSFIASTNAVKYVGATPVFADVDPLTQNLTPESIESVLSSATKAVLVVHQAGMPADIDGIRALCEPRGVAVLEDAACAVGALYKGRPISGAGGFAAFSFHPRKVLSTGEGGAITTDDPGMAEILRSLTTHGLQPVDSPQTTREQYVRVGFDYAMCDPLAAIGMVQLRKLDAIVHQRRVLGERYRALLGDIAGLQMIADTPYGRTNYQAFWVLLPEDFPLDRDATMKALMERGIMTRRGVMAAHLEPPYADVEHVPLPVTERITKDSLTLPLFHDMTPAQQDHVISAFREIAGAA
jgi:dTDP-4-amino-4,6-dideoxygalactose transaminase